MDFSDEPYVRKYTRKTLTSRLLGWEGRAVRDAMLDEFDAAGIFAIRGDASVCISAVTEIPVELVRIALQRLVETETWVVTPRAITWPTYEEAQNCMRSDRLRQRESRKARAARSVTDVTAPVAPVTPVTAGHAESQPVTPSHTKSLSPPSSPPSSLSSSPPPAPEHVATPEPSQAPTTPEPSPDDRVATPLRRKSIFCPDDFAPDETHRTRCQELRFDLDELLRAFKAQEFNREYSDWPRRFSKWIEAERVEREKVRGQLARAGPNSRRRDVPNQPNAGVTGLEKAIEY